MKIIENNPCIVTCSPVESQIMKTVNITQELHRKLKIHAATTNKSIQELVDESLHAFIKELKKEKRIEK